MKMKDESFLVKGVDMYNPKIMNASGCLSDSQDELSFGTRPTTLYMASGVSAKNESTDIEYQTKLEESKGDLKDTSEWVKKQKEIRDDQLKIQNISETEEKISDIQMLLDRISKEREKEKQEKQEELQKIRNLELEMKEIKDSMQSERTERTQMMALMLHTVSGIGSIQNELRQMQLSQIQASDSHEQEVGM